MWCGENVQFLVEYFMMQISVDGVTVVSVYDEEYFCSCSFSCYSYGSTSIFSLVLVFLLNFLV